MAFNGRTADPSVHCKRSRESVRSALCVFFFFLAISGRFGKSEFRVGGLGLRNYRMPYNIHKVSGIHNKIDITLICIINFRAFQLIT